ncbi:MAG TPA: hypothetical protein VL463_06035 [Kofleriaceae bacterium]|nr:hypothetical protein [Kofleriaceae bacterium]
MNDLELWRRLLAGHATPADVAELAGLGMAARAPYLAWLERLARAEDPAMRAAVMRALSEARGVPGVRAIVAGLDDDEAAVRANAVASLAATARSAPMRAVHALFHPRPDVRRAALAIEAERPTTELAAYLRADPACAELAARAPWPAKPLELAFDLYAHGALEARELIALIARLPVEEVRRFLAAGPARSDALVEKYLEAAEQAPSIAPPPGLDVLDAWIAALDETGGHRLDVLISVVSGKKRSALTRRAVAAMLPRLRSKSLVGACVALEPRVIAMRAFDPALAAAGAAGLVDFAWPVRLRATIVAPLFALPIVRTHVELAVAIAGLFPAKRLEHVVHKLGDDVVLDAIMTDDRVWDAICKLPAEASALELGWLARVAARDPARYFELAGRALAIFPTARAEAFVARIAGPQRARLLIAFAAHARDADRLATICKAFASGLDAHDATAILAVIPPAIAPAFVRALSAELLAAAARPLDDDTALALVAAIDAAGGLPWDLEAALSRAFEARAPLAAWIARVTRVAATAAPIVPAPPPIAARALTSAEQDLIGRCAPGDLDKALRPAMTAPVTGLCTALAMRAPAPSLAACAALLGCADPLVDVAFQLDRFADRAPTFGDQLDFAATSTWLRATSLPPLAHARLWRWEAHATALGAWIKEAGGVHAALVLASSLPGRLAVATLWRGIVDFTLFTRYRDRARFAEETSDALASFVAEQIDQPIGRDAAQLLVTLVETRRVSVASWRDRVVARVADANAGARELLVRVLALEGLPEPPRADEPHAPADAAIAAIRATSDVNVLAEWCADPRAVVVQEAVLRLLLLGARGQTRLVDLLPSGAAPIVASIALWDPPALRAARSLWDVLPAPARFHLALAINDRDHVLRAFEAAHEPGAWFGRDEWELLIKKVDKHACAIALADAPHHHAYQPAIAILVADDNARAIDPMRRFLELDALRPLVLRRDVARRLLDRWKNTTGLPLVAAELATDETAAIPTSLRPEARELLIEAIVGAALIGGHGVCAEKRMVKVLDALGPELATCTRILDDASLTATRAWAAERAVGRGVRDARLAAVADRFAWGVRRGVELTGRLFRVHMTSKESDLGFTHLHESRVYVSPLPMLRGEQYGDDIVEGLILHELGHHLYHRGEEADRIWKRAREEGLGALLNLVADEHLERNLRAIDPAFGDRLKRLGAYAFHHAAQEIAVAVLLGSLRANAAIALGGTPLDVAFAEDAVRIRRGAVLGELDRAGHPLARFTRALRMGLGNRHRDARVAEALALCKDIRRLDMPGLWALTQQIAALFGGAVSIAQVFGGPEGMCEGDREREVLGAGLDDDKIQREVDRILDPRKGKSSSGKLGPKDRLGINVNPDERFNPITRVVRVRGDAEEHRKLAHQVTRHATRLRALLDDLGLRWEPARARLAGRALDRTRLRPLVIRNDPRILIARTPVRKTDLFLGTLIDCSGSMQAAGNLERARRFAALIAEAVRPLRGVDARFFGFTDSVIYDAGDAHDCGITALRADGGNNDAAALLHVANLAAASPKRARVLVMISDGLPTECSVPALRGLVTTLTKRKGMVCAQVAVRPLAEVCFPHYVVLDDAEPDVAVARFGRMIGDLARRVLSS